MAEFLVSEGISEPSDLAFLGSPSALVVTQQRILEQGLPSSCALLVAQALSTASRAADGIAAMALRSSLMKLD